MALAAKEMYDSALMGILQSCGKLQPFLDAVFSFLARRTDFYILMKHERARMGFPPGVAENMVVQAFKKYEILMRKKEAEIMREEETKKAEQMSKLPSSSSPGAVGVSSSDEREDSNEQSTSAKESEASDVSRGSKKGGGSEKSSAAEKKKQPEEGGGGGDREKKERAKAFNYSSDVYNGADMESYKWSQTVKEVEIKVALPEKTTGKQVKVDIQSDRLRVEILRPEPKVVMDGKLTYKVKVDESMWNVDRETCTLCINLEKTKELMWKSVLEGEKEIDLTKVDNSREISEFDEEAQAAIQRASYDHRMKMQGLPTSSDKKAHDMLKKAWNAEGSPFKGTPFDPSRVQISGNWN